MYTLYGAEISYFSGKARSYLDWKGISYEEKLANRDVYENVILPRVGWPVIPVVVGPEDEVLQDTSDIIDTLDARLGDPSVYPDGSIQRLAALLFELIGDEWLVVPAMHYRWAYNRDYAYQKFGEASAPDKSPAEQYEVGKANAVRFEGALPFLGITPEIVPAIEAAYLTLLEQLSDHFSSFDMLLGSRPSIGDFGLYGPLYAHLYLDPASGEIMKEKAPIVARWVERMRDAEAKPGEFLPNDEVPETAQTILREQLRDFVPVLVSTARALTEWAGDKSVGEEVPRALGPHVFRIGTSEGNRMILPFNLWMLQRVLDHLSALNEEGKMEAVAFLDHIGAGVLMTMSYPRLERRNFKLCLA